MTPAQLYYVVNVYPEHVPPEEAEQLYDDAAMESKDILWWETATKVVMDLCTSGDGTAKSKSDRLERLIGRSHL